ncbi:heme utilization protein [Yersinia sp. 1252 StPb PI]|uniref:heme utilization protein n=1 Tax=unclassified Yersinia (in: enterobacteria) TaxID=2653513 RepID=UPI003B2844B6
MRLLNLLVFILLMTVFPGTVYAEFIIKNLQTSLSEMSMDVVFQPGGSAYVNYCRPQNVSHTTLERCLLTYKVRAVTSGGLGVDLYTGAFDLRGDGTYDQQLLAASTMDEALAIAQSHGVILSYHIVISRSALVSISGTSGNFAMITGAEGKPCNAAGTSCYTFSSALLGTYNFNLKTANIDVVCEASSLSQRSATLSGPHIYVHDSNGTRLSQAINPIDVSMNCVNWSPTANTKAVDFVVTPSEGAATGSNTQVACGVYKNTLAGTASGYTHTQTISLSGFGDTISTFSTPALYFGVYVKQPSSSAETSLPQLNCEFSGEFSVQ